MSMELRHLRYFVAIGEEENYRRAAQRLNVAQTALSTQIQDLEAELGFKLFDRLPRGVKLSAAGKLFLEDARRILQQVNEAAQRAARVARGQSGTLRIGFTENASWRGVVLHQGGSTFAHLLKRGVEASKLFRAQFTEHFSHLSGMLSEGGNDKILSTRGQSNDPDAPVLAALDTSDQAFREKAVHGDTDRTWCQIDDGAYRIDGQRSFM